MPSKGYGRRGQEWHPAFIEYMQFIASHPTYKGMPDAIRDDDLIQWEAPSNRKTGKYKDTHRKRLDWWRQKAIEVGIDPNSAQWISRTAKVIHPTKSKPCKRCGRTLDIRYVYPRDYLLERIRSLDYVGDDLALDRLEPIAELIARLYALYGDRILDDLPKLLATGHIQPPILGRSLDTWLDWVDETYVSAEPSLLSPGAMSNAPDRFDGFHSFNLCCRSEADTGRHPTNLKMYGTDRRVFEYWNDGDWIAADRMMGLITAKFADQPCASGHVGPCDADHIGPLSLGFGHWPAFQLLCSACNSAKNNRMSLRDVRHLCAAELRGETVISWHSRALWDARKGAVVDEETALRLSKLLRDNRHTVMYILRRIAEEGHYTYLATFLHLERADYNVEFENLRVEDHITRFDNLLHVPRHTKYAAEQKARRLRIAFMSLRKYFTQPTGNAYIIQNAEIERCLDAVMKDLQASPPAIKKLDQRMADLLNPTNAEYSENGFRNIVGDIPKLEDVAVFVSARQRLENALELVADELTAMWTHERYVRSHFDPDS